MSTLSVRRPLAVLAVLAMVATLLFAVAGTASAATVKPSDEAVFSACPANANIPDAGFTDIPTASFFDDAVNCLAYYATTTGTTPTTYSPADDVTRSQMAVFLYRMASEAGVVLSATPPDAGFTDISELSAEAQTAINALADKGIVKGKTATTYSPADPVWRQQMALFLTRFSDAASAPTTGPGGTQAKNTTGTTTNFTDLGGVTVEANTAIIDVFHLGVAAGTTATTYDPLGNVNRGQMSLFLTRLAAHMNVRPAGVNIQADPVTGAGAYSVDISVTARNADFSPSANTLVDIWRFLPTTAVTTPFNSDGTCNLASGTILEIQSGGAACRVELVDPAMAADGNWPVFSENASAGDTLSFYAWTGTTGSTFDNDTTVSSMVNVAATHAASDATFKSDVSKHADTAPSDPFVEYGQLVTVTVQLTDGPTSAAKPVAKSGVSFTFMDEQWSDGVFTGTTATTVKTDAAGKATYEVTQADPNPGNTGANDDSPGDNYNVLNVTGTPNPVGDPITLWWDDDDPYAYKVVAGAATDYKIQSPTATNSATATLYDQYGAGLGGKVMEFTSNTGAFGIGATAMLRSTNSNGVATYPYVWGGNVTAVETISVIDADGVATNLGDASTDFYWVDAAANGDTVVLLAVLVDDVPNAKVVGNDAGTYKVWTWAAGDQFNLNGSASSQSAFETAIAVTTPTPDFDVSTYWASAAGVSSFNVIP